MNLNKNRKNREVEGSNQLHAKARGERPTSGLGRPAPVAKLRGPFADVQARCVTLQEGWFGKIDGVCRPAGRTCWPLSEGICVELV